MGFGILCAPDVHAAGSIANLCNLRTREWLFNLYAFDWKSQLAAGGLQQRLGEWKSVMILLWRRLTEKNVYDGAM